MKRRHGEYQRSGFRPSGKPAPVPQIPYVTGLTNRVSLAEAGARADASKREGGPDTEGLFLRARQRSEVGRMCGSSNYPKLASLLCQLKRRERKPGLPKSPDRKQ